MSPSSHLKVAHYVSIEIYGSPRHKPISEHQLPKLVVENFPPEYSDSFHLFHVCNKKYRWFSVEEDVRHPPSEITVSKEYHHIHHHQSIHVRFGPMAGAVWSRVYLLLCPSAGLGARGLHQPYGIRKISHIGSRPENLWENSEKL